MANSMHSIGGSSSQHLSWRSAFFGISGLALNTMFQEAGSFEDIPELLRYVIRSSPIACAADIILTVCRFIDVRQDHSLIDALRIVAILRYPKDHQHQSSGILGMQAKSALVFGTACLQLLKLMACEGISWTQAAALIYMTLNLIDGLLRRILLSTPAETLAMLRRDDYNKRRWKKVQSCISVIAVLLQFLFWTYILTQALPESIDTSNRDASENVVPPKQPSAGTVFAVLLRLAITGLAVIAAVTCIFQVANILWDNVIAGNYSPYATPLFLLIPQWTVFEGGSLYLNILASVVARLLCFWVVLNVPYYTLQSDYLIRAAVAVLLIPTGFFGAYALMRWLLVPSIRFVLPINQLKKATNDAYMHPALLVTHVMITLVYYKFGYDPKDTFKPKWTDWLG
jgi:hypothetical protein